MMDTRLRIIKEDCLGSAVTDANAQLCFFTAHRKRANPANSSAKAAEAGKNIPAERHVAADQVANRLHRFRHPLIGAADHPVEFLWEPAGPPRKPEWFNRAADTEDILVDIVSCQT